MNPESAALRAGLLASIRRRVARPEDAEDLLQDVLLRAVERADQLRDPARADAWLARIADNAVKDFYRAAPARARELGGLDVEGAASAGEPGWEPAGDPPPEVQALAAFSRGLVAALPPPYRAAIELTDLEGLTQREAAAREGVSLSGMKSRVQRGRARLREQLLECCEIELDARRRPVRVTPRGACGCAQQPSPQSSLARASPPAFAVRTMPPW